MFYINNVRMTQPAFVKSANRCGCFDTVAAIFIFLDTVEFSLIAKYDMRIRAIKISRNTGRNETGGQFDLKLDNDCFIYFLYV